MWAASADDVDADRRAARRGCGRRGARRASSAAARRWTTRGPSGSGTRRGGWSSGALADAARGGGAGLDADGEGDVTHAFWAACHGGQREAAERCSRAAPIRVGGLGRADARAALPADRGFDELADWVTPAHSTLKSAMRSLHDPWTTRGPRDPQPRDARAARRHRQLVRAPAGQALRRRARGHEMISSFAIHYGNRKTLDELLVVHPDEGPVAIQLFGHDPEIMRSAAARGRRGRRATSST